MATDAITGNDVAAAFARIEDELLESMMRNLARHGAREGAEGFDWAQWQAAQIAELERYARKSNVRYGPAFDRLNDRMAQAVEDAYRRGYADQEAAILDAVSKGFPAERQQGFLRMPEERMDVLVGAVRQDMARAEYATLRQARDVYRKAVFDAQVYATSGAGTYAKAVDMAVGDSLRKGLRGITYRNGSRHSIEEYSRMAVRTAARRAALTAEGQARRDWGVHTVFVNYRVDACPECMPWVGRVLIDDVYSGGTSEESRETGYPLLSEAMAQGLFHPNCRDTSSTYFEGLSQLPERPTAAEKARAEAAEAEEQRYDAAALNAEQYGRAARLSLDMEDRRRNAELAGAWQAKAEEAARSTTADIAKALEGAGLSREQAGEVAEIAGTADTAAASVFVKYIPEMKFSSLSYRGTAAYSPFNKSVRLNYEAAKAGNEWSAPWDAIFHELGHLIDDAAVPNTDVLNDGWISLAKGLGESIKREGKALAEAVKKENGYRIIARAWGHVSSELAEKFAVAPMEYANVADLLGGAAGGSFRKSGLPGHAGNYFKGEEGLLNLGTEAFAEFFSCSMCNPAGLARLKEYFPESYELFMEILEELARG